MSILTIAASIIIALAVLLITRQVFLWYWKVNKVIEGLSDIREIIILSIYDEIKGNEIIATNTANKKDTKMTISQFLNHKNKSQYKIKL